MHYQNTLYYYNRMGYNPAATGVPLPGMEQGAALTLLGRYQWMGIEGAPRMAGLSYQNYFESFKSGIGATLVSDQLGPITSSWIDVSYAFQMDLGESLRLRIGVNGGVRQNRLSPNWIYNTFNGEDPILPGDVRTVLAPSLGAGLYLTDANDKFFVGLSGQDLLEPSIAGLTLQPLTSDSRIPRSFFLMGGYRFDFGVDGRSSLTPSVMLRTDGIMPPQADVSVRYTYKPIVLGLNYRFHNDSFSGILGFNVSDRTFLGYAYDYTLSPLNSQRDVNSHEIILT
ncbi:MAG: type IX secretion system membrane protein PorP/SprF, partial [Bacteroidetes bacterium]